MCFKYERYINSDDFINFFLKCIKYVVHLVFLFTKIVVFLKVLTLMLELLFWLVWFGLVWVGFFAVLLYYFLPFCIFPTYECWWEQILPSTIESGSADSHFPASLSLSMGGCSKIKQMSNKCELPGLWSGGYCHKEACVHFGDRWRRKSF